MHVPTETGSRITHLSDGKIDDAGTAFQGAREEHNWYSVKTFETPFRHEGKKTMGYEPFEAFDWSSPDHVLLYTGAGCKAAPYLGGAARSS